jgi:hypothetical protein
MYKCLCLEDNQNINILARAWSSQLKVLHDLDHRDQLVCPGCMQPVRVKAGQFKRWHFAHKHLTNCPFQRESAELLHARAVLFRRLVDEFDETRVVIEKQLSELNLPRPLDVWVDGKYGEFAYWIIDTRLPPNLREIIRKGFSQVPVPVNVVILSSISKVAADDPAVLYLSTTEREFCTASPYDATWKELSFSSGKSIHYLNLDCESVITYRNLQLVHLPQQHTGKRLETPLAELSFDSASGEIVHPGERERLLNTSSKFSLPAADVAKYGRGRGRMGLRIRRSLKEQDEEDQKNRQEINHAPVNLLSRQGVCRYCGKKTTDWVQFFGDSGECICRECQEKSF